MMKSNKIIFHDSEKKVFYVGALEIFAFVTIHFLIITFLSFSLMKSSSDTIDNSTESIYVTEQQYLAEHKKDYLFYKSVTYKLLDVSLTMLGTIFFLMFLSAFINAFKPKEKREYLIIGIDLIRIFSKQKKVLLSSITLGHPTVVHARNWFWL